MEIIFLVKNQFNFFVFDHAMGRDSHHTPLTERLTPDAQEPVTEDPVVKMDWYLKTRAGKARYAKRKCTVEPVFGIIKQELGFRQFSLRGLDAVTGEWKLVAMAFNLKRMHTLVGVRIIPTSEFGSRLTSSPA